MRLNVNLATQKYEEVREFYLRWSVALTAALVLTVVLALLTAWNYSKSSQSGMRIKDLQQKIASLQRDRAEAEAIENSPENRDVTEQKNYWNTQIARRAFSWTQLFNDLQRIMPGRAYVVSVKPELTTDNRLKLNLTVAAEKHENGLELVKRMESSSRFRQPQIGAEAVQKDSKSGISITKFEIQTFYTPAAIGAGRPATKEGM
ncbi:MAG: hypothetical protein ACRD4F_12735 [Candidatus Angelobacter sp.]